jgi:hypothetical protein
MHWNKEVQQKQNGLPHALPWDYSFGRGGECVELFRPAKAQDACVACVAQAMLDGGSPTAKGATYAHHVPAMWLSWGDHWSHIAAVPFCDGDLDRGYHASRLA